MNKLLKRNNQKSKTIIIIFSIISLISLSTIVYSAFSSTMHITGTAHARVEANVRITDFRLKSTSGATSSYEEFGKSHINTNINLTSSSSSITYYLEITNYGSVDVGILNITGLPDGVSYSIKDYNLTDKICNDDGKCNGFINKTYELTLTATSSYSGNIVMNFDFRTYHNVIYTDITNSNYPTEVIDGGNLSITFKEDLKRVQLLSNNNELVYYKLVTNNQTITVDNVKNDIIVKIKDKVAKLVNGMIDKVGSEVCIGNECFYVMKNDGLTVTLLAKYNLYIGSEYNNGTLTDYGTSATGIQDASMTAWSGYSNIWKGVIKYAESNYWQSNGTLKSEYGSSYPVYVYDSNSNLYNHVENYKDYLEGLGVAINNARIMSYEEAVSFGCSSSSWKCSSSYPWIYSTTYWLGSAYNSSAMWRIATNMTFDKDKDYYDVARGIRPVIEIDIDEIVLVKTISGNLFTVGSEICLGEECFYVIGNDGINVKLLSKYNLYVGYSYDGSNLTELANATGIQDSSAVGYKYNPDTGEELHPFIATVKFSNTNYWSSSVSGYPSYVYDSDSLLYNYVENYKNYLLNYGIDVVDARIISYDELVSLGCNGKTMMCTDAPGFVYSTSYWVGDAYDSTHLWDVSVNGTFGNYFYKYDDGYGAGIRPVIEIPISSISDNYPVFIDGNVDIVGSEFCLGDQCFNIIKNNGSNVVVLAKYNLLVGNKFDDNTGTLTALSNPTGIQDPSALGFCGNGKVYVGVVRFFDTPYWTNVSSYPSYVYNNKSSLYNYIENYRNYINSKYLLNKNMSLTDARLINYNELVELGCNLSGYGCNSVPKWVRNTTYWTGSAFSSKKMYIVDIEGRFGDNTDRGEYATIGVRPVLSFPIDFFQ